MSRRRSWAASRDALFGNLIYDTIMSQLNWPLGATLSIVLLRAARHASPSIYSRYMGLSQIFKGLAR